MSFTFYDNIPAAPNNPSNDQPLMLQNNISQKAILAVDHITFGTAGAGEHQKVTFNSRQLPPAQTDPKAVLYTNTVSATATNTASASTVSELFFRNQNAGSGTDVYAFPISMIKAFGSFDGAALALNTWNMSAVRNSVGVFTITLPANIVTGSSYQVFPSIGINSLNATREVFYAITNATTFQLAFRNASQVLADPDQFSVMVMQL